LPSKQFIRDYTLAAFNLKRPVRADDREIDRRTADLSAPQQRKLVDVLRSYQRKRGIRP